MNITIIIKLLGTKTLGSEAYSLYLNEVRENLTSNPDRSPLIKEPLGKSCGEHWLPARFGIKSRLRRHAVACQEVATPSPDCAGSPAGLAQRFPGHDYASGGDQSTLFAKFSLTNSSGTNLNSFAGPKGEGQEARSNFVPFMQYAG